MAAHGDAAACATVDRPLSVAFALEFSEHGRDICKVGATFAVESGMSHAPAIGESLREYGRGLAGGLIFSLPLLYTMEVWWAGFIARPERVLIYLAAIFVLLLGYNNFAGMRRDATWTEVMIDSVEELGLGLLTSFVVLWILGRLDFHSLDETLGQTVIEGGIVAIGFSIGTAQLGADDEGQHGRSGDDDEDAVGTASQVVIAFCGAVLFAANVAPTEEILLIAVEISDLRLIALALLSFAIGALILFFSEFRKSSRYSPTETHWQKFAGSVITYATALVASAAILWFFGRFDGVSAEIALSQIVVLGFPATLGASAGRLLLQP